MARRTSTAQSCTAHPPIGGILAPGLTGKTFCADASGVHALAGWPGGVVYSPLRQGRCVTSYSVPLESSHRPSSCTVRTDVTSRSPVTTYRFSFESTFMVPPSRS